MPGADFFIRALRERTSRVGIGAMVAVGSTLKAAIPSSGDMGEVFLLTGPPLMDAMS